MAVVAMLTMEVVVTMHGGGDGGGGDGGGDDGGGDDGWW